MFAEDINILLKGKMCATFGNFFVIIMCQTKQFGKKKKKDWNCQYPILLAHLQDY